MLSLAEKIAGKDCAGFARRIGEIAGAQGVNAYLVGGFVRDVLLGICSPDIDFMLEGDALLFVEQLSRSWSDYFPSLAAPARIAKFSRYKTAKIWFAGQVLPGVDRLDFSSARTEHYPVPGGRPVVASGDLYADLARRDFSVNAMAINITSGDDGMLCDFFGGQDDLALKLLRVLHARSFIDDPVRAIRAARLMSRLGFTLEPETAELLHSALQENLLSTVSGARLLDELRKALCEQDAFGCVCQLQESGLLEQIEPLFLFRREQTEEARGLIGAACKVCPSSTEAQFEKWHLVLAYLLRCASDEACRLVLDRFAAPRKVQRAFEQARQCLRSLSGAF